MAFKLTVPEAAAAPDTIQFKFVLENHTQDEQDKIIPTFFRTFQQISWIHHQLKKTFPTAVLPSLPEPPLSAQIDDQDHVERKRLQIERYFNRITHRKEMIENLDFLHFLSSDMSPSQVGPSSTGVLSFLKFNRVIKPSSDRGLKPYKASEIIEGRNHETFHKHQIYILAQESYYGNIAESLNQLIQVRENLGDEMATMGDLIIETTQSKYRLGLGLKVDLRDSQRNLDRKMQMLGLLMDELGFVFTRQGKEENMRFGDVMVEYKNLLDPLKVVFNTRTDLLKSFEDQLKSRNKKRDRLEKLKLRLIINHPEVKDVIAEEVQASEELGRSKAKFNVIQAKVKREIKLFEKQKAKELKSSIKDYVNLSLRFEKINLDNLEKTLRGMEQPIGNKSIPFMYQQQHQQNMLLSAQTISPTNSLSTSNQDDCSITSSLGSRPKKRRQKVQKKSQEFKKPLKSSASLPTNTALTITATNKENNENDLDAASTSEGLNNSKDETHNNSRRISASYDDRLSSSNWAK